MGKSLVPYSRLTRKKEGWKPCYDQPEGKPTAYGKSILIPRRFSSIKDRPLRSVRPPKDISVNESDRAEPEPEQIDQRRSTSAAAFLSVTLHNQPGRNSIAL